MSIKSLLNIGLKVLENKLIPKSPTNTREPNLQKQDGTTKELKSLLWDFKRDNYHEYLQSKEWKQKRLRILRKAGFKCRKCGKKATEVHHETYERIFNERDTDLTALCRTCHDKKHI